MAIGKVSIFIANPSAYKSIFMLTTGSIGFNNGCDMTETTPRWKIYGTREYTVREIELLRFEVARIKKAIQDWRRGFISHDEFLSAHTRHQAFHLSTLIELQAPDRSVRLDALRIVRSNEAATAHVSRVVEIIRCLKKDCFAGIAHYNDFWGQYEQTKIGGDDASLVREWALQLEMQSIGNYFPYTEYPLPSLEP